MSVALPLRILRSMALVPGLLCAATMALPAQQPAASMGSIHGRVINPAGTPQKDGTVSLSVDGGVTLSYSFPVSESGDYSGEAPQGEYTVVYRAPNTPEGKIVDFITGVQIINGQDTVQDVDMTRQEFISRLSPGQQLQLQALREANAAAASDSKRDVASIDADLKIADLDFKAAENARLAAVQNRQTSSSAEGVDEMTEEIEEAKLAEIETLMTKDAAAVPTEPIVWIALARAETGLENYLDAEDNFKKALELAQKEEPVRPEVVGAAEAGLGEIYARTLRVDEANAAFDAATKADPQNAARYLRNQAIFFFDAGNFSAQVDAADTALKADPDQAILYYVKAAGLAMDARINPDSGKLVLPAGCADAFRKYLQLDPNGAHAAEASSILARAGEDMSTASSAVSPGPATPVGSSATTATIHDATSQ